MSAAVPLLLLSVLTHKELSEGSIANPSGDRLTVENALTGIEFAISFA
jgi:hypothetical protein